MEQEAVSDQEQNLQHMQFTNPQFSWITAEICPFANLQSNFYSQVTVPTLTHEALVTVT